MKNIPISLCLLIFVFLVSCESHTEEKVTIAGSYHASLDIAPDAIPFDLVIKNTGEKWSAEIHNGEEVLEYEEVRIEGDSLLITMNIFDSDIRAVIKEEGSLQGVFIKNYSADYRIPFIATKEEKNRFEVKNQPSVDFSGRWKTVFQDDKGGTYEAIAIFEQKGDELLGTFLTNLGDYRYLEGNVSGNTFFLSAFNGGHAFFFTGDLVEDGSIQGRFRSGPRYQETLIAVRDEDFELPDAYSLTKLKDGYDRLEFSFPDVDGNQVSLSDPQFKDKVVLVQLFGTWCPNCMDETKFLAPWYDKHKADGVEIIALAFESKPDFDYASARVKKAAEKMDAGYTFLIAGVSNKQKAAEALPALSDVLAFPTLIYIDKQGEVRKIHTGFTGPATGGYYDRWVEEHEALVKELLNEG